MQKLLLLIILTIPFLTKAQEKNDCMEKKDFLIIHSSKDYKSALLVAQKASKSLNINLDLRELSPVSDTAIGLSFPYLSCKSIYEDIIPPDTNCYIARGRSDDGDYISIEYSSAYSSFARGYYIVVVSSGLKASNSMKSLLAKVKTKFKDAYIKSSWIYVCCMF
jgi:hypothetical protein